MSRFEANSLVNSTVFREDHQRTLFAERPAQLNAANLLLTAAGGSEYELQELARGWSKTAAWQEGSLTMCWSPERRAGR